MIAVEREMEYGERGAKERGNTGALRFAYIWIDNRSYFCCKLDDYPKNSLSRRIEGRNSHFSCAATVLSDQELHKRGVNTQLVYYVADLRSFSRTKESLHDRSIG